MKRYRFNGHWVGEFYDETYRETIFIIWPVDGSKVTKFAKEKLDTDYDVDDDFTAETIEFELTAGYYQVLAFKEWGPDISDYSFLAHEAFHAAKNILRARGGNPFGEGCEEPLAALIESIVRRSLTLLDKRPVKKL